MVNAKPVSRCKTLQVKYFAKWYKFGDDSRNAFKMCVGVWFLYVNALKKGSFYALLVNIV